MNLRTPSGHNDLTAANRPNWVMDCIGTAIAEFAQKRRYVSAPRAFALVHANQVNFFKIGKSGELTRAAELSTIEKRNLGVRLTPDKAVIKQLNLPAGARDLLPAIIQNKVETMAPWPLSQAIWGYRELTTAATSESMTVETAVISRKSLDGLINKFAQDGAKVVKVEVAHSINDSSPIALQTGSDERLKNTRRLALLGSTIAILTALGVCGYGLSLALKANADLAALQDKKKQLTSSLLANGQSGNVSPVMAVANAIHQKRAQSRPFASVVNGLSALLPDTIWLDRISYSPAEMTISGYGRNVPPVIETLEQSPLFQDSNFSSATQRDDKTGMDQFTITTKLSQAELVQ